MTGFQKGTGVRDEIEKIAAAFRRATAAIQASPDLAEAFRDATALSETGRRISNDTAGFRAYLIYHLNANRGLSYGQLAEALDMSPSRIAHLARQGREQGNPVENDQANDPELPSVAAAIITSDLGVLIEQRHDKIPPWTFPAGEIEPGESAADTVRRRVPAETGLTVTSVRQLGRRIHPRTERLMIYLAATVDGTDAVLGDPGDLAEVKWATVDETRDLMPDMFPPVRAFLDEQQNPVIG
jgi:8-oxo-dGTP diphosphatase